MKGKVVIGVDGTALAFKPVEKNYPTVKGLMDRQAEAEARRKQILTQRAKKCQLHNEKVRKQSAKAASKQHDGNNSCEAVNVECLWITHRLKELFKPPATSDIFEKSLEFDAFARLICDKSVIKAFDDLFSFAQESVKEEDRIKGSARLFLAAMLIDKYPSVLNTEMFSIKEKSYSLALAFKKWEISVKYSTHPLKMQTEQHAFLKELRAYAKIYREWQKEDMKVLEATIQEEYEASTKLLEKVADEEVWEPHVAGFQSKVGKALSSLGSSPKSEKSAPTLSAEVSPKEAPVPVAELLKTSEEKPDIFLKPDNVQMAHDLYMEGTKFDYFKLYGQPDALSVLDITSNPSVMLEFVLKIGGQLADMVPQGKPTHKLINEAFDRSLLESQIKSKAFDPIPLLSFTVDICSKLCAESRDAQVESLKTKLKGSAIDLNQVCTDLMILMQDMQRDLMNYNLAMLLPRLPTIIVQYERDAFIHTFHSNVPVLTEAANSIKASIMSGQTLTPQFLAAKVFVKTVLEEDLPVETYCWDKARLSELRKEILSLAKKSAVKLVEKNEVLRQRINSALDWREEPTLRIIYKRILDCIRKDISASTSPLSSSPEKQGITFPQDYEAIRAKSKQLFEHNLKVFEPLYHHISQQ